MALNITGMDRYDHLVEDLVKAAAGEDRNIAVKAYNAIKNGSPFTMHASAHETAKKQLELGQASKFGLEQGSEGLEKLREDVDRAEQATETIREKFGIGHDNGLSKPAKAAIGLAGLAGLATVGYFTGANAVIITRVASALSPSFKKLDEAPRLPTQAESKLTELGKALGQGIEAKSKLTERQKMNFKLAEWNKRSGEANLTGSIPPPTQQSSQATEADSKSTAKTFMKRPLSEWCER